MDKCCGTCARGCHLSSGMVACGAPVDEDGITRSLSSFGRGGSNPIWAERKYNPDRLLALAAALRRAQSGQPPYEPEEAAVREPEGSDCENMQPGDGSECKVWEAHPELVVDDDDEWMNITVVGVPFEEEMSRSGKRRHRPLQLRMGRREFGEELGTGPWRPGPAPS